MSNIDKQALRIPERKKHNWGQAVMRDCDFCQQWALTVRHSDGGCICASCCDSEYTTALSSALVVALDELEAAEKRIAELESRTVTVKLPNGDRDIAAFRIDPTEGPSWLTFRCEEDLRENGVIGEFDSVVPLSLITNDAPKRGEVVVTVSALTGSGKSAIAGEIEIAMKAIGVPVKWMNGDAEKRMTGADWLTAIEMYKPTVRIVEVNVPRAAGIGVKGE